MMSAPLIAKRATGAILAGLAAGKQEPVERSKQDASFRCCR
jgi:hypothetical protein